MDKADEIVPQKIKVSVNYKVIALIIGSVIVAQIISVLNPGDIDASIISIINPVVAGIVGISVGLRYYNHSWGVFSRAYVSLGIGMLCTGIAEILYVIYDLVFNESPFPSIADVFFLAYYPFILAHLVLNIRYFKLKFSKKIKLWLVIFPIIYASIYFTIYSQNESDLFLTTISMGYIVLDSFAISLVIAAFSLFRKGLLGTAWLILLFGMLSISFADVWYYQLEAIESFNLDHPVNMFWYAGYWIVTYGLLKHRVV